MCVSKQDWQVELIKKAVERTNSNEARFINHQKVVEWVNSWSTDHELPMP